MGKLGFVNICHPDYANEISVGLGNSAIEFLQGKGIEILGANEIVTNHTEAFRAARKFVIEDVEGIIIFYGAFVLSSTVMTIIKESSSIPLLFWGVPMMKRDGALTTTGSYVAYSMFNGTLERLGIPHTKLIGEPESPEALAKITAFAAAAKTLRKLKRSRIGLVGYTSMSIYPGTFDHVLLRYLIGPEVEHIDSYTLINKAEQVKPESIAKAITKMEKMVCFGENATDEMKKKAAGIYVATKELCRSYDLDGITIKCQYEFSKEYEMTPCVPLSLLAEDGIVASCEGDMPCAVSSLILNQISGNTVSYGDAIHHEGDVLKLSPCGFMPFSLGNQGKKDVIVSDYPYFKGLLCSFVMHPGKVTMLRLVEDIGDYHLFYFTGEGLESELRGGNMPSFDIRIDGSMEKLIEKYPGQHFAICYGDYSEEIEILADMLGITAKTI